MTTFTLAFVAVPSNQTPIAAPSTVATHDNLSAAEVDALLTQEMDDGIDLVADLADIYLVDDDGEMLVQTVTLNRIGDAYIANLVEEA